MKTGRQELPKQIRNRPSTVALASALLAVSLLTACDSRSADSLLDQAQTALSKQDVKTAEIHLKNLLQQQPDNGDARVMLATVHQANRDERSAEKEWRRALELGVSPDRVLPGLMESLVVMGEAKAAIEAAGKYAATQAPAQASVAYWSGRAYQQINEEAKADQAFKAALGFKPDYRPAQLAQIQRQLSRGNLTGATSALDALLVEAPALVDALILKSDLLVNAGNAAAGRETLAKAIESEPRNVMARLKMISLLVEAKDLAAAEQQYEQLRQVAPNQPATYFSRATLDFRQNKLDSAASNIQLALRAAPEYLPAVALAANVALAQNSLEQAESYAKQLTARAPEIIQGTRLLATVYLRRNDFDRALQTAKAKIDRGVEDPPLLSIAGEAALRRNDIATATDYLARAAKLDPKDANKRAALGIAGLAAGNTQMGFTELQTAVDLDPESIQADLTLITERLRARQFDQALAAVDRLQSKQPDKPLPHNLRGTVLLGKGDRVAARASFEKALSVDASFFPAAANLAQLDFADKKFDAAKKRFSDLIAKDPKNVQALVALAQLSARTGSPAEDVTKLLRQAQEANPAAVEPLLALAQQMAETGKPGEAIPMIQRAVAQQPENAQLLDALGTLYLRTEAKQQAIDTFEKIVRLYPNAAPVHMRLGEIKASMGDSAGAMTSFRQAADLDRKAAGPQYGIAAMLLKEGKREEALKAARTFQQQLPNSTVGFSLEGDLLAVDKQWPQAAALYQKALAIERSALLIAKQHNALRQGGRAPEAEALLRNAIQAAPNDLTLRMYAGEQAMAANQWKVAVEHYESIAKVAPENFVALNNLAWCLHELRDPRALAVAESAYSKAPQSAAVMDTLGIVLLEKGDSKRALELLKQAANLAPKAADIRWHYAQALAKTGDKASAKTEAQAIEREFPDTAQARQARELGTKL